MSEPLILVVEDESKLAALLGDYLEQAGYRTHCIADGMRVLPFVHTDTPDLILLDLMLPGKSGLDVCREIRAFSQVPIIMLTARVEEIDRLLGLELGADDYICKPYSPREVVARVKAVLRRVNANADGKAQTGVFRVDEARMSILVADKLLDLTPMEFRLLATLLSHPGRVYSRNQLLDKVRENEIEVFDRIIDTHVKNLRKKIAAVLPEQNPIRSVYGVGYKLELDES